MNVFTTINNKLIEDSIITMRIMIFVLLILSFFISTVKSYEPDRIIGYPGLDEQLRINSYSGYLNGTSGTYLHYVFIESQNDPTNDPVLLWLNGGPGASSLLGFFTEQGPVILKNESKLTINWNYSWNKFSNMIFLESPAGVGYSYNDQSNYTHDDDSTSLNNLKAIKSFFAKFPQFKANEFYISGESYGGVYIPTLSVRLLDEPTINYKGFAIGNGHFDANILGNSMIRYAYHHGFIGSEIWSSIVRECCRSGDESFDGCQFVDNANPICSQLIESIIVELNATKINMYAINDDCLTPNISRLDGSTEQLKTRKTMDFVDLKLKPKVIIKGDGLMRPCADDVDLTLYMRRPDVRTAFNIPSFLPKWNAVSAKVNTQYNRQYNSLAKQIVETVKAGKRGLIYNGDADMICDFLGAQRFSDTLGIKSISKLSPWYVDDQVAGFVKYYDGFLFATVKGAGHTVPEYRPKQAFALMKSFLQNVNLNDTLCKLFNQPFMHI